MTAFLTFTGIVAISFICAIVAFVLTANEYWTAFWALLPALSIAGGIHAHIAFQRWQQARKAKT